MDYTYEDIVSSLKFLGLKPDDSILVVQDIRLLGKFGPDWKDAPKAFVEALKEVVDPSTGTIVMPTTSPSLQDTDVPYNPATTPSESGVITEYFRKHENVVRSHHALLSYAAFGKNARFICTNNSRHAFGLHSPEGRLIDLDATIVAIGRPPNEITPTVHHAEQLMAVPYRYVKEINHPVVQQDGSVEQEIFYRHVWYRDMDFQREGNKRIFEYFRNHWGEIQQSNLGRGIVSAFSARNFLQSTCELMARDPYVWMKQPPKNRPFRW